jgi:flagellar basal-body rod modification protein FlgD
MSTIQNTTGVSPSLTDGTPPTRRSGSNLDKDAFLQILITQLKYQDPTKPMEDREFISQMAQFSSLEQMTNVSKSLEALSQMHATMQSASLVGRTVEIQNPEGGDPVTGAVEKVNFEGGTPSLVVGGKAYPLGHLLSIH